MSGAFVGFVEELRKRKSGILFLSSLELDELPCDEHVLSRLQPGAGLHIRHPEERDMADLLDSIARQRGFQLSVRKRDFSAAALAARYCFR